MSDSLFGKAAWVWPSQLGDSPNQYVQFRQEFVISEELPERTLRVSCDSNYAVWLNGEFVGSGQFHDYPDEKVWDAIALRGLRKGRNVLAFVLFYQGVGSFQYIKGAPGLLYALEAEDADVSSGAQTMYRRDPGYVHGEMARISPQLGFAFGYDASGDDEWRSVDYRMDAGWSAVTAEDMVSVQDRPVMRARPIRKLVYGERIRASVVGQGVFTRRFEGEATVAEMMWADELAPGDVLDGMTVRSDAVHGSDGAYVIFDLGREEAGLLDLDIEAASGTVIDIAWGEHLDAGRVSSRIGPRNFACRYVCGEGRRRFTHYFARLAGRYIELHISGMSKDATLHYAGLIPVEYPLEVRGSFASSDELMQRVYDTSVRTLHLCMHEHYEDCPWREQALYAMDMRNQALAGYYCFGEYAFPAVSLGLLAKGLKPDGFLEMCAPAEIEITIPVFTLAWILAVGDHYRYSGDREAARRFFPTVSYILSKCAEAAGDGLLPCPTGSRYWHFYDWADGLNGCGGTGFEVLDGTRHDAPLNLFYCLALEAGAYLAEAVGDGEAKNACLSRSAALKPLIHERFWDPNDRSYVSFSGVSAPLHRGELMQALAVLAGVCDEQVAISLRERLASDDNGLVKTTLSYSFYKYEAMLTDPEAHGRHVLDAIARDWGYMLDHGATSFWETIIGSADFGNAGSLCHGWSGIPAYFYHAYVLGVKPTAPGFAAYERVPLAEVEGLAHGCVPTPDGVISV